MGEVAGVAARLFGLVLIVGEKLVDLLGQRLDLVGKGLRDAGLRARPDCGDILPDAAKGPEAVEGLKRGEDQQANAERQETPEQGGAKLADLCVDHLARLRDLETPADVRPGQDHVPLGYAQRLAFELVAVVDVDVDVTVAILDLQTPVPQRS